MKQMSKPSYEYKCLSKAAFLISAYCYAIITLKSP